MENWTPKRYRKKDRLKEKQTGEQGARAECASWRDGGSPGMGDVVSTAWAELRGREELVPLLG